MRTTTILIALTMLATSLAGCTGGDPDAGGNDEFDAETLQGMIEAGLQDFMNNTTVEINYYTNETSTTTNNVNGSGGVSSSSLHALSGTDPGESSFVVNYSEYGNELALLVRADAYANPGTSNWANWNSASVLDGANICVAVGSIWEAGLVNWFSSRNIAFTTVPVAGLAEANAKFIDGSCDAMAGELQYLVQRKASMDADGSMGGVDIWVTNTVGDASGGTEDYSTATAWSVLNLTIEQDYGVSSYLLAVHGEITLTGTCIANCTNQSAVIYHTYVFSTESFASNYTTTSGGIDYANTCEGMTYLDSWPGYFGPPGLECELDMTMFASLAMAYWWEYDITSFDDYDFAWSDWSYYVLWQSTAVTMHE
uniref:Uncharacterized protein n=1 Tax=uncultured marine group II/III euryarchaeote KM3_77_B08 TaxID=1456508 RepID=A0A075HLQ9_9EURY|nr:hypothetical protein [uncultured marine group II/III euryarchaeote KM3_77_B08]